MFLPLSIMSFPTILDFATFSNILLLGGFVALRNREWVKEFGRAWVDPAMVIISIEFLAVLFTLFQLTKYILNLTTPSAPGDTFAKPLLFPCRTSHTRFFPKKHSFSYSYLLVGIPVGWRGSVGGMVSADVPPSSLSWYSQLFSWKRGGAWHVVNGDDYLARGHAEGGLREKLDGYLVSQGYEPEDYPNAYLLTSPRFLGYSSNPVSIWNLYSSSNTLKAMILEVNNTFDERHTYFLSPESSSVSDSMKAPRYSHTWPKDFYVSVFNSRTGAYSISTSDPLHPSSNTIDATPINTTITLSTPMSSTNTNIDTNTPMLTARVFSTTPPVDPSSISILQKTQFLLSWCWVGLATFPRTVVQAVKLLNISMPWVSRPEPRKDTMSRKPDELEMFLEPLFHKYLENMIESSDTAVKLRYISSSGTKTTFHSPSTQLVDGGESEGKVEEVEIRVLTPLFYTRFIHYAEMATALIAEEHSETISLSPNSALILTHKSSPTAKNPSRRLKLLTSLRQLPAPIICVNEPKEELKLPKDVLAKTSTLSEFEEFLLSNTAEEVQDEYVSKALKVFVSDHIALGMTELLDLELWLAKALIFWWIAGFVI